eukprot:1718883-Ditylum_brightwellii.AAC.1
MMLLINPDAVRAVVEYQGATTAVVQNIMKCVVADKSEENYNNENIMLLLCPYNEKNCVRTSYKKNL